AAAALLRIGYGVPIHAAPVIVANLVVAAIQTQSGVGNGTIRTCARRFTPRSWHCASRLTFSFWPVRVSALILPTMTWEISISGGSGLFQTGCARMSFFFFRPLARSAECFIHWDFDLRVSIQRRITWFVFSSFAPIFT